MNRVAIVTGGAQGIGRAIACALLEQNWSVAIFDREPIMLGSALSLICDVASEAQVQRTVAQVVHHFGSIQALVNNAGFMGPRRQLEETSLEEWQKVLDVNLTGAFLLARACAPELRKHRGAILNIGSTRHQMSEPNTFAYSASKGGMVALTHSLAASLAPVRVNCLHPGWIHTGSEPLRPEDHEQHWSGRVGKPEDVGALAAFLLSEQAGFVTGAEFTVDGGMTRKMIYAD